MQSESNYMTGNRKTKYMTELVLTDPVYAELTICTYYPTNHCNNPLQYLVPEV